jgi:Sap, sulfolipid-1-addressing protein
LMGAAIAGLELLTAFPYFAAIAMIVGSGVSDVGKLSLLVLYCVIYTLPLIAITIVITIMGRRAEHILRPVGGWLSTHWPVVVAPLTCAFGIGRSGVRNHATELDIVRRPSSSLTVLLAPLPIHAPQRPQARVGATGPACGGCIHPHLRWPRGSVPTRPGALVAGGAPSAPVRLQRPLGRHRRRRCSGLSRREQ